MATLAYDAHEAVKAPCEAGFDDFQAEAVTDQRRHVDQKAEERSMSSQADRIRRYALERHVRPWRESGASTLSIRAGDVERSMELRNRTPNVCSALESRRFQQEAGLVLVGKTEPHQSTTTTFRYQRDDASAGPRMGRETERPARSNDPGSGVDQPRQTYSDTLPVADLCLVSCVKTKLREHAPGKELYVSPWFRKARAVIEAAGWPWYILSAKYGVIDPDTVIEPYEKTLNAMRKHERIEWSRRVMRALDPRLADVGSVVVFAGGKYRELLAPALHERGITVHVPMEGLRSGEQLAQLNAWIIP